MTRCETRRRTDQVLTAGISDDAWSRWLSRLGRADAAFCVRGGTAGEIPVGGASPASTLPTLGDHARRDGLFAAVRFDRWLGPQTRAFRTCCSNRGLSGPGVTPAPQA